MYNIDDNRYFDITNNIAAQVFSKPKAYDEEPTFLKGTNK